MKKKNLNATTGGFDRFLPFQGTPAQIHKRVNFIELSSLGHEKLTKRLSNFDNDRRAFVESVVEQYKKNGGKLIIYIVNNAYDNRGVLRKESFALMSNSPSKDHGAFWVLFESMKEKL